MKINKKIRDSVIKSLPEAKEINDTELQSKVYDAWAISLQLNGYSKIEEMEHSGTPGIFVSKNKTQTDHLRGVTRLAIRMVNEFKDLFQESTAAILKANPQERYTMFEYLVTIVLSDRTIVKPEVAFLLEIGSRMLGLSENEMVEYINHTIQSVFIPRVMYG